jgi:hypothetical protein
MTTQTRESRLTDFERERDSLNRDFYNGLIEPATMELLTRRLSDKYCAMVQKDGEK